MSSLTIATASPRADASTVLAQAALWFGQHSQDAPPLGDRVISLKVEGRSHAEKMAALSAIAKFLDVEPDFRNQVWFAQRRFGEPGCSITLDAHYTPDHDAAFAALQQLAGEQDAEKAAAA
jgi:hypothetical protein